MRKVSLVVDNHVNLRKEFYGGFSVFLQRWLRKVKQHSGKRRKKRREGK